MTETCPPSARTLEAVPSSTTAWVTVSCPPSAEESLASTFTWVGRPWTASAESSTTTVFGLVVGSTTTVTEMSLQASRRSVTRPVITTRVPFGTSTLAEAVTIEPWVEMFTPAGLPLGKSK